MNVTPESINLISAFTSQLSKLSGETNEQKISDRITECDEYLKSVDFTGHYLYIVSIGNYTPQFSFYCLSRNIKLRCNMDGHSTFICPSDISPSIIYRSNYGGFFHRCKLVDSLLLSTLSIDQHIKLYLNYYCQAQRELPIFPLVKKEVVDQTSILTELIPIKELTNIIYGYL
jgi:hypothetical protein